jgi:hypothetical protein
MDTFGEDIADERFFRDVSPGKDGFLQIGFSGVMGPPSLNAIRDPVRLTPQATPDPAHHANHAVHRPSGPVLASGQVLGEWATVRSNAPARRFSRF